MALTMYHASVPVLGRYLAQLAGMVALAQDHATQRHMSPQAILQARLAPAMHPFATQVEIATNFVLRACAPLAGVVAPDLGEPCDSFADLKLRIARTQAFLATLTPAHMAGSEERVYASHAGLADVSLDGPAFLQQYALPNFFFHLTTAYAILRHIGVEIGKADFDGFHVYAPRKIPA